MADDNSDEIIINEEIIPEIPIEEIIPETIIEEVKIKPKAKGRPKESKDKLPRPKRKVVIKEEPIEIELPRAIEHSIPIPAEANNINKYALMLELLHQQKQTRLNNKSEMYKSWFRR